ncbi:hypothetical protein ES703_60229 [subsurface metagenome]
MKPSNLKDISQTKHFKMKQLKSSSQDLRYLFENITVKHVLERLQCCNAKEDAVIVKKRMKKLDFDVMGIKDKGITYGYVKQSKLKDGLCNKHEHVFHPSELVAESMPLIELLPILHDNQRVFVLERNKVNGIVTRGDLQKAPVRLFLFGLVTLLEMNLLYLIKIYYPKDSWTKHLKDNRLKNAEKLQSIRKDRNEAIDLADCLQFCDKRDLILKKSEILKNIGIKSKKSIKQTLESAEKLRNNLAHALDIVKGLSWTKVINLAKEIELFIKRCEESYI